MAQEAGDPADHFVTTTASEATMCGEPTHVDDLSLPARRPVANEQEHYDLFSEQMVGKRYCTQCLSYWTYPIQMTPSLGRHRRLRTAPSKVQRHCYH
eukprot:1084519-Amphidinium_carterae.1